MGDLVKSISSRIFALDSTPEATVSIKVDRKALKSAVNNSIRKRDWFDRNVPVHTRRRVSVEAAACGTNDSIFFAQERPNVNLSSERVSPTEFVKVNPNEHDDVVRQGDDFEIAIIGMSVSTQDYMGDNELLLCSLARKEDCIDHTAMLAPDEVSATASTTIDSTSSSEDKDGQEKPLDDTQNASDESAKKPQLVSVTKPLHTLEPEELIVSKEPGVDLSDLPTALPIRPGDIPFLHYDPESDGHGTGSEPDTFVPIPGTKRLFIQRKGSTIDPITDGIRDVVIRFTVMEIDKLSEEQLIAVKSLEEVAKSVGKAASSVPYLKFISWLLKFANTLGRSALKKVSRPDHVLSMDVNFMLAPDDDEKGRAIQREEYGNYLRVSEVISSLCNSTSSSIVSSCVPCSVY